MPCGPLETVWSGHVADLQRTEPLASISAGAARADEHLLSCSVGWAASNPVKQPTTPDTQYRIGSITKTFTSALTLLLAEEGALGLDDRVGEHLPPSPLDRVTIRQLLSHSGGLQRETVTLMWQTYVGPDVDELLKTLPESELVSRPGERWHYSNLGYAVIGRIVDRAAGVRCEELIQERLWEPLGLTRTTWRAQPPAAAGYAVDPYQDLLVPEPEMDQRAAGTGGQVWSTTSDLLTWAQALMGRRPEVLPVTVVDAMHTLQVMVDTEGWSQAWGLGLILNRFGGRLLAGHTGAMPGYSSALFTHRSTGSAAVVLANCTRAPGLADFTMRMLEAVIESAPPAPPGEPWSPGEPCPVELEGVLGRWWSEYGETVFSWRGGRLRADLESGAGGVSWFDQIGPDEFRATGREHGERLLVLRGVGGRVEALEWATYRFSRTPR